MRESMFAMYNHPPPHTHTHTHNLTLTPYGWANLDLMSRFTISIYMHIRVLHSFTLDTFITKIKNKIKHTQSSASNCLLNPFDKH